MAALDIDWLRPRLRQALDMRESVFKQPFYRWVHGEADGLPGLVIDRFGQHLTIQISTAGMQRLETQIVGAVGEMIDVKGIVMRADDHFRELEGLTVGAPQIIGDVPDQVEVCEGSLRFETRLVSGQKTGWYFDQRDNRTRLARYIKDREVLDVFSYAGAWGITAAAAGARSVTCIDSSAQAIELAQRNAILNSCEINPICDDAFDALRKLGEANRRFQVIVLDPPALIKRKKDYDAGRQAYYQLNRLAAKLLADDGLLISCSCSHHLPHSELVEIVHHAARTHDRRCSILEIGQQSADHPIHPAIPETAYLKAIFVRMVKQ